jgi:hypothetical protein
MAAGMLTFSTTLGLMGVMLLPLLLLLLWLLLLLRAVAKWTT